MNLISTQRPRRIWKGLWHLVTLCLRCCWTWPRRAPASGIRGLRSRGQLESLLAQFCPRLMAENICCSCVRMCKSYVSLSGQHQEVQQRVLLPKKKKIFTDHLFRLFTAFRDFKPARPRSASFIYWYHIYHLYVHRLSLGRCLRSRCQHHVPVPWWRTYLQAGCNLAFTFLLFAF